MNRLLLLAPILAALALSCNSSDIAGGGSETGNSGVAYLQVETFDSPPPSSVEHLLLDIRSVEVSHVGQGWITVRDRDTVLDYLSLVGGATALIVGTEVHAGRYNQMRLVLGDSNSVVIGGVTCPLTIPSSSQTGIKIKLDMTLREGETSGVYLDFDLARSVVFDTGGCTMSPVLRAFPAAQAGTIDGTVRDTSGQPVKSAVVTACGAEDTLATLTRSDGGYRLFVPNGVYTVVCTADSFALAAPAEYPQVIVEAKQSLAGLDFELTR